MVASSSSSKKKKSRNNNNNSNNKNKNKEERQQQRQQDDEEEVVVDYAAAADLHAASSSSSSSSDDDDVDDEKDNNNNNNHADNDANQTEKVADKSSSSDDDDDDEETSGSDDGDDDNDDDDKDKGKEKEEKEEEADDNDDDDSSENEEDEDEEEEQYDDDERFNQATNDISIPNNNYVEPCTFDLRNLLAINAHPINTIKLYNNNGTTTTKKKKNSSENVTIAYNDKQYSSIVNEEYLLQKAEDGCNQIVSALWQLPVERSDLGPMIFLPTYDDSRIPRALPPPKPKEETKWEKFAKAKGIPLNKEKRSRKVFDEATGEWMYRHGYQKANNDSKEWPIMEVKNGDDPYADPWEKQRETKRARIDKNIEQHMRNEERSGTFNKGTTTRILKSINATRKAGKLGSANNSELPAGVPVDMHSSGKSGNNDIIETETVKRGKVSTMEALLATQRSTASLGKFDKMRDGEPERKKSLESKRKKYESNTPSNNTKQGGGILNNETERSIKLLKTIEATGGIEREKLRKKGKLATGETPYDYDYNDGLGPSTYRKKKGRAGAGKLKKMTKKRVK